MASFFASLFCSQSRSCRLFIPEHLRELFKEEKEPWAMGPVGMVVLGRTPLENLRGGCVDLGSRGTEQLLNVFGFTSLYR